MTFTDAELRELAIGSHTLRLAALAHELVETRQAMLGYRDAVDRLRTALAESAERLAEVERQRDHARSIAEEQAVTLRAQAARIGLATERLAAVEAQLGALRESARRERLTPPRDAAAADGQWPRREGT